MTPPTASTAGANTNSTANTNATSEFTNTAAGNTNTMAANYGQLNNSSDLAFRVQGMSQLPEPGNWDCLFVASFCLYGHILFSSLLTASLSARSTRSSRSDTRWFTASSGLINFAHGDIYMVGAHTPDLLLATSLGFAAKTRRLSGLWSRWSESMAIAAAIGMAIERFAYRPVRKYSKMTTLITAIGMSLLIEYLFVFHLSPEHRGRFRSLLSNDNITLFGNATISTSQILIFVVSMLLMVLLQWIIYKTKIGKAMRAVSFNINSAKLMGINTTLLSAFTFALGSALGGCRRCL